MSLVFRQNVIARAIARSNLVLSVMVGVIVAGSFPCYGDAITVDPANECRVRWAKDKNFPRKDCWKEWEFLIYMAADNDLSPYGFRDIWEAEGVGSAYDVDVHVFNDSLEKDGNYYYHLIRRKEAFPYKKIFEDFLAKNESLKTSQPWDQEEAFLNYLGRNKQKDLPKFITSPVLFSEPESDDGKKGDSGNVESAGKFIKWVLTNYPSRRLMILGWSHGEGFSSQKIRPNTVAKAIENVKNGNNAFADANPKPKEGGFAFDYTSKTHMDVMDMSEGIKEIIRQYRKGHEIDIVGSDACLNQEIEFVYQWKGMAEYFFGSSQLTQGKGFNYRLFLDWFTRNAKLPTDEIAKQIPILYEKSVNPRIKSSVYSSYLDPSATMTTLTVSELDRVRDNINDLASSLTAWVNAPKDEADRIARGMELQKKIENVVNFSNISKDLYNFLQVIDTWAKDKGDDGKAISKKVNACMDSLRQATLAKYIGPAYAKGLVSTSKGVAIWIPLDSDEYKRRLPEYEQSRFYKKSEWATFLKTLYQ